MPPLQNEKNVLYSYQARAFEQYEKSVTWYVVFTVIGILLLLSAIFAQSPMMFLVFLLLFVVIILISGKEPPIIQVEITKSGIILDNRHMFRYEDIEVFSVFKDPPLHFISLHMESGMTSHVRVPLGVEDPEQVADIVEQFVERDDSRQNPFHKLDHILKI